MKAAKEARIAVHQARADAGESYVPRTPAEALVSAVHDADAVTGRLRTQLQEQEVGHLDAFSLDLFGGWLDRVGRLAKAVIDTDAERKIVMNRRELEDQQAGVLVAILRTVLQDPRLGITVDLETRQLVVREAVAPFLSADKGGTHGEDRYKTCVDIEQEA